MAKPRKTWKSWALTFVALAVVLLGALVWLARPIAAVAISVALTRAGIAHEEVGVRAISLEGITLAPVRLGAGGAVAADTVDVRWTLEGLRNRTVERVRVEKLRLEAAVGEGGLTIQGLDLPAGAGGPAALPFPVLELTDAEITVRAPGAVAAISGDAVIRPGAKAVATGRADISLALGPGAKEPERARFTVPAFDARLDEDLVALSAPEIRVAAPEFDGAVTAKMSVSLSAPTVARAVLSAQGKLRLPGGETVDATAELPVFHVDMAARLATFYGFEALARSRFGDFHMATEGELEFGERASANGHLWFDATLPPRDGEPVRFSLSVPTWQFDLGRFVWNSENVRARLTSALGEADLTTTLTMALGKNVDIEGRSFHVGGAAQPAAREPVKFMLESPEWRAHAGGPTVDFTAPKLDVAVGGENAAISGFGLTVRPGPFTESGTVHATITPDRLGGFLWPPVNVTAEAERDGDIVRYMGTADAFGTGLQAAFEGYHDLGAAAGSVSIQTEPVDFTKTFQPAELVELLPAAVRNPVGKVEADAEVSYGAPRELSATVSARLDGFGFDAAGVRVSDIKGRIAPLTLFPAKTAAVQRLSGVVHADPAPPMPLTVAFGLPGDGSIAIDTISLAALGGTVSADAVSVVPGRPLATHINVAQADLAAVTALIDIEGLSGTGTLSGEIPVRIDGANVDIASGALASAGPGVLKYTGGGLDSAAAAAGESARGQVELLRSALRDFRYDSLSFGIERDRDGNGTLGVHLAGHNPAVLDGHPFNININLETNFDRIAAVLLDGVAAANRLMKQGIGR